MNAVGSGKEYEGNGSALDSRVGLYYTHIRRRG